MRFLFLEEVLAGEGDLVLGEETCCCTVLRDLVDDMRDLVEDARDMEEWTLPIVNPGRDVMLDRSLLSFALLQDSLAVVAGGAGAGLVVGLRAGGAGLPVLALLASLSILT